MYCPRCGKALPEGAAFCMFCGQAIPLAKGAPIPSPAGQIPGTTKHVNVVPAPAVPSVTAGRSNSYAAQPAMDSLLEQQQKRTRRMMAISMLCLLVIAAVVGISGSGLLQKLVNGARGKALQKPYSTGPSGLEKVAQSEPADLGKTAERVVMPDDIRNWLEHLHQTEISRIKITNEDLAQARVEQAKDSVGGGYAGVESALNGADDPNSQLKSPVEGLARMIKDMHDHVRDVQKQFDAFPAPAECVPIQASYDQALGEEASELGDLGDHLASGDVAALQSMQGTSAAGIDSAGAKTDRLVGEICDKYETKKWFSINKDIAPGGVFSLPGF